MVRDCPGAHSGRPPDRAGGPWRRRTAWQAGGVIDGIRVDTAQQIVDHLVSRVATVDRKLQCAGGCNLELRTASGREANGLLDFRIRRIRRCDDKVFVIFAQRANHVCAHELFRQQLQCARLGSAKIGDLQAKRGRGAWPWIAAAVVVAALGLALGLSNIGGGGSAVRKPERTSTLVPTVQRGARPADEAQNLSRWLRSHSR